MDLERSSGLLLHATSLPSPYGVGDIGPEAYRFADACAQAEQRVWQMLPVGPVAFGYSPYASPSALAGSPLLISPHLLLEGGLLTRQDLAPLPEAPDHRVDYERATAYKERLLDVAFARFEAGATPEDFGAFCEAESAWLDDHALFCALKDAHGGAPWTMWPAPLARREESALDQARRTLAKSIRKRQFRQYVFDEQWRRLHAYCRDRGILIAGDLPIYVAHDSVDVWARRELFFLEPDGAVSFVAGVPPDFFSETGQRWGNPLYRWDVMQRRGFRWWTQRLRRALSWFDMIRLDHFRGFASYWEVPAHEDTAVHGRWAPGPGEAFFERIEAELGPLPLIAENLGIISEDVTALMQRFNYPGMAVLQFAFSYDMSNEHLPHNYTHQLVAYTGTHDNDTLLGWWTGQDTPESERAFARRYLALPPDVETDICWPSVRALMASVAGLVITPVQDVLRLPREARMNLPGTVGDNWDWRLRPRELDGLFGLAGEQLRRLTQRYGR